MTLPITPYRWFNGQDVYNDSRILRGIEHLMTDNGRQDSRKGEQRWSLVLFVQGTGDKIEISFYLHPFFSEKYLVLLNELVLGRGGG